MGTFSINHPLQFSFGLLGNIVSCMVYLAPLPTFYRIHKKKSTEGFQSIPYVIALYSFMLWMYYALLKTDAYLLITINAFGCVIETIYISLFIAYAPRKARIFTTKLLILLNFGSFCLIILVTTLFIKGPNRVTFLGWVCVAFATCVFAAPLTILRMVIQTKSVEFMPFWLSFFLTLCAVAWFAYGFLLKDIYIAFPNILGFLLGVTQMILYAMYKNKKKNIEGKMAPGQSVDVKTSCVIVDVEHHEIKNDVPLEPQKHNMVDDDSNLTERINKNAEIDEYPMMLKDLPPPGRLMPMSTNPNMAICIQA